MRSGMRRAAGRFRKGRHRRYDAHHAGESGDGDRADALCGDRKLVHGMPLGHLRLPLLPEPARLAGRMHDVSAKLEDVAVDLVHVQDGVTRRKVAIAGHEEAGRAGHMQAYPLVEIVDLSDDRRFQGLWFLILILFLALVVFSFIGYFYVKNRGRGWFARRFIPTLWPDETEPEDQTAGKS